MLKVLIAEDDVTIAGIVQQILTDEGYDVCGIARTVAVAVALSRCHEPDLAIIDLRLADGGLGSEIPAQLGVRGKLGVLYVSGSIEQIRLTADDGEACLAKPYCPSDLLRGLEIVAGIVATGSASPPFPRGFVVLRSAAEPGRMAQPR